MATIERRHNRFRLIFYYAGQRYATSLKTTDEEEADTIAGSAERTLSLLDQGVLDLPAQEDLVTFVLSGGRRTQKVKPATIRTLRELRDRYLKTLEGGAVEANSLATINIHLRHLTKTLGSRFPVQTLSQADVQRHIDRRSRRKQGRKKAVGAVTLKKEVTTMRACWNWGFAAGLVGVPFPSNKNLKYPKSDEKPPFQTREEIERKIARGGVSEIEVRALWDCLFLSREEIDELLAFIKDTATHPFLHPMFVFAAPHRRPPLRNAPCPD